MRYANLNTVQITITFSILYFLFITYVLFGSEDFVRVALLFISPSLFLFESLNQTYSYLFYILLSGIKRKILIF